MHPLTKHSNYAIFTVAHLQRRNTMNEATLSLRDELKQFLTEQGFKATESSENEYIIDIFENGEPFGALDISVPALLKFKADQSTSLGTASVLVMKIAGMLKKSVSLA
jgi:hypothetical protein